MSAFRKTLRACWNVLPIELRAMVKNTPDTVRLDYPGKDLYLHVDTAVALGRATSCAKEPGTIRWLEEDVRGVLYDIGANVGAYSLVAWAHAGTRVVAFEPGFSTFPQLCRNILLNHCQDAVTPLNVALSDRSQLTHFRYNELSGGAASHVGLADGATRQSTDPVVFVQPMWVYSLDDAIAKFELEPPDHIKIDVDGHELAVLRGARGVLAGGKLRTLQIEIDDRDPDAADIRALMASHGFTVTRVARHVSSTVTDHVFTRTAPP